MSRSDGARDIDGPIINSITGKPLEFAVLAEIVCAVCDSRIGRLSLTSSEKRVYLDAFGETVGSRRTATQSLLQGADYPNRSAWCSDHGPRELLMKDLFDTAADQIADAAMRSAESKDGRRKRARTVRRLAF